MRNVPCALALVIFAACGTAAFSQTYPSSSTVRTTDVKTLQRLARAREIHERFALGLAAEKRGDWQAAAAEFERIGTLGPAEPQASTALYDLALAYANSRRLDEAARALREAIKRDPGFLAAMANLVAVDIARGDLRDARAVADRFVAVAPDSARALYSRGITALRTGDAATARNDFGRLLKADPSYAVAHYDLGIAQEQLGEFAAAEREFSMALDLAPDYARARFALGAVLLREGRRREARAAFDRVAGDSANDVALRNLAIAMRNAIK